MRGWMFFVVCQCEKCERALSLFLLWQRIFHKVRGKNSKPTQTLDQSRRCLGWWALVLCSSSLKQSRMYFLGVHFLLEALEHSLGTFIHAHFLIYCKKISEWQFWYSWCQKKKFKGHKLCLLSLSVLLLQLKTAKEILICSLYLQSGVTRDVWVGCQVLFNLSWGAKMLYSLGRTYLKKLQLVIKKYYNKNLLLKLLCGVTVGLHLLCCVFTPTVVELWGITELSAISFC